MCMRKQYLLLTLLSFGLLAEAQLADSLKAQLLRDWKRSKAYTLEYLETMPAEKYAFRPQDSIRTFAQQMIHLAQGTVSLMQAATDRKIPERINRPQLENINTALSKDSVQYFIQLSYDYAIAAMEQFDLNTHSEIVQRGRFRVTRMGWMLKAYEHQAHHRGQTTIYIRTAGFKPPNEKLFD